jgi:probable F420-dependent oxidoreductase
VRLGFFLPQIGPAASKDALVRVAKRAEELDYRTVWVTERLLFPLAPQTPYAGTPDGSLPEVYRKVFDPVETLTFVAARTDRIKLGTSVLDIPYYNPLMLGRRLATLDVLSGGRVIAGFGQGWSKDEHDAMGVSMNDRASRADEFLLALKAVWTQNPSEFHGKHFTIAKSYIDLKPAQQPHPPIYLAAFSPGALQRVGRLADGWHPVALPPPVIKQMLGVIHAAAKEAGRDPKKIDIIVRANYLLTDKPLGEGRFFATGSAEELKEDIEAVKELGASEMCFDPTFSPDGASAEGFLRSMERIRKIAG